MDYTCDICNSKISNKKDLLKHQRTDKCQNIKKLLDTKLSEYLNIISISQSKITQLEKEITTLKKQNEDKDIIIKTLEEKAEEYRKIVEKCAVKSTTTNNVVTNKTYNNHLNYISSEPINFKDLKQNLSKIITVNSMLYDDDAFNNHIINNILKDENGKDKVLCTDINRKNFSYKDETSGELISDPELEKLREKLRNGVDIKIVRNELLYKLIDKYRERTDIDPYEKLCYFLEKLEFGDPFVVQVAKKTYIKSKNPLSLE
jgi:hypothetical protein